MGRPGDGTVVVRPSWRAYGKDLRKRAPFAVGMLPLILASFASATAMNRGHAPALLAALLGGILGLVLTVGAVYTLYYMLGRKLLGTVDEVRVVRLFRKPAIVPVSSIHKVVRCTLTYSPGLTEPAVFGMDESGRCVLSLYAGAWRWGDPKGSGNAWVFGRKDRGTTKFRMTRSAPDSASRCSGSASARTGEGLTGARSPGSARVIRTSGSSRLRSSGAPPRSGTTAAL